MKAVRYRLRFVTGVSLSAATYGSGFYGGQTYGTLASDPVASARYRLVPWPGGYLTDPAWQYRQNDTRPPFKATVFGDEGPLQLVGVVEAQLVLTPLDRNPHNSLAFALAVTGPTASGAFWLGHDWLSGELNWPGVYSAGAVITYSSGRRLTVPIDDRQVFVITDNEVVPGHARWDAEASRWDEALWSEGVST